MNIAALPTIPWRAKSSSNPGRDPTMPRETRTTQLQEKISTDSTESRLTGAYLVIALLALCVGVVTGLLEALSHAGVNLYPQLTPVVASYYQGLTLHGVMNALVWTTFFICGFLQFMATRAFGIPLASRALAWKTYGLMTGGLVLAAIPLLSNAATVMFTFYSPLKAH